MSWNMRNVLSIALLISLVFAKAEYLPSKFDEKCPFKDTVDLTGLVPFDNGSYVYQNMFIPSHKISEYNYRLGFRNFTEDADLHKRGCVCGNNKSCVKLCCEPGHFYSEVTYDCQQLPENLNEPTDITVTTVSGVKKSVNIFDYFIVQTGKPCKYLESLTAATDKWELQEVCMYINRQK